MNIYVNNQAADMDTKVYENFSVIWTLEELELPVATSGKSESNPQIIESELNTVTSTAGSSNPETTGANASEPDAITTIHVVVNKKPLTLSGKKDYIFVDVFDYIDFDLSKPQGTSVETLLNGEKAGYTQVLTEGDVLDIFWKTN